MEGGVSVSGGGSEGEDRFCVVKWQLLTLLSDQH